MISNPVAEDTVQETTTYRQHRLRVQERIRIAARWLTTNLLLVAIWGVLDHRLRHVVIFYFLEDYSIMTRGSLKACGSRCWWH